MFELKQGQTLNVDFTKEAIARIEIGASSGTLWKSANLLRTMLVMKIQNVKRDYSPTPTVSVNGREIQFL